MNIPNGTNPNSRIFSSSLRFQQWRSCKSIFKLSYISNKLIILLKRHRYVAEPDWGGGAGISCLMRTEGARSSAITYSRVLPCITTTFSVLYLRIYLPFLLINLVCIIKLRSIFNRVKLVKLWWELSGWIRGSYSDLLLLQLPMNLKFSFNFLSWGDCLAIVKIKFAADLASRYAR